MSDSTIIVPVCQREGCNKPLRFNRVYLWIRRDGDVLGEQCVFCEECAAEICREQQRKAQP